MAKYYGAIGIAESVTGRHGEVKEVLTEKYYMGDMLSNTMKTESGDSVNDDYHLNSRLSIIVDPYIANRLYSIRYITYMGAIWKVKSIEHKKRRGEIHIGGIDNG